MYIGYETSKVIINVFKDVLEKEQYDLDFKQRLINGYIEDLKEDEKETNPNDKYSGEDIELIKTEINREQEDINNIKAKIIKHKKVLKELRRGNK